MVVILICIHWLEHGRYEFSSDLSSNRIQSYSTVAGLFHHSFYIQKALVAKYSHKAIEHVKII